MRRYIESYIPTEADPLICQYNSTMVGCAIQSRCPGEGATAFVAEADTVAKEADTAETALDTTAATTLAAVGIAAELAKVAV